MRIRIVLLGITLCLPFMAHGNIQSLPKTVDVEIGKNGFQPSSVYIKKGEALVLMVNRTTDRTCMKELKHPKSGRLVKFPLNKKVKFEIGSFSEAKKVSLLCGMNMKAGVIHIQ